MKKSLLALIALCLAAMLVFSSCSGPVADLLDKIGLGGLFGNDEPQGEDPEGPQDPVTPEEPEEPEIPEDPIEIPDPEGKSDSNTYVLQFPLLTIEEGTFEKDGIKAIQVELNKTLTMRIYAVPESPETGKPPVITFSRANKTGVGYGVKNATSATLGDDVYCFEYASVPVSVLGRDSEIVMSLANTKEKAVAGNFCEIEKYTFDAYFDAVSANDTDIAEAVALLEEYSLALNEFTADLTQVKSHDKNVVSDYVDAFTEYGNQYWKYQRGEITEKPVAPALPPLPSVVPVEEANVDLPVAEVEGFTMPEGTKAFELTPSTKKIEKLKNYVAGVYVDFTGTAPVLVFRLVLDDIENIDVRLNDYRISAKNLQKAKEVAKNSVDGETLLNDGIKDLVTNSDELDSNEYYLIKTDTLTFKTLDKEYTLTIYDEENNAIESLTYSAVDYIRSFAAGRTFTEETLNALIYYREEILGAYEYLKDENGEYILDENGRRQILYQYNEKTKKDEPVPIDLTIYETDDEGNFILDTEGKKIPVYKIKYQKNSVGEILTDSEGNKIPAYDKYLQVPKYQKNSAGEYILDGNGEKIPAYNKYLKDGNGANVLDEFGAKVPAEGAEVALEYSVDEFGAKIPAEGAEIEYEKENGKKVPETRPYVVETQIVTYRYPVAAEEAIGKLLIAWYNLSQNAYLNK